ncbi:MAG: hypothetical protein JWR85_1959 [Marmoricola sp.]|nr:hypothetical protein [Marmoricola sp.]
MAEDKAPHRAGLFDIRFIIGALIGLYGLIILITGLFTSDAQVEKADGLNINITAGIGMLVVSAAFGIWAWVRPIIVPADPDEPAKEDAADGPAH